MAHAITQAHVLLDDNYWISILSKDTIHSLSGLIYSTCEFNSILLFFCTVFVRLKDVGLYKKRMKKDKENQS